ncbi:MULTISPECIES: 2-C-methyl-D-erythritol 4-phosphate cytidylyltransferase [unclassified Bordetella]|uniref:2-C-methyl-D-erythritol 4-phosphate cytidylyltransferase n=1 Tax=unclassified Bordetella TaxID=2630031 RepID=UPI00132172CA|nr:MULTISPECIES: 2-C-methyl-D-erythritol 4-phosphate cytidylyltransferase [unclassified Bordetella]MVW73028.1 2-C-methyl-D-erythritol 4-phosphate cytidylyltransferase [Bordetella sp. 15P40C-2]MVW79663.1 2-C-methyl-D-erythritol 4-phosphate cytidylyltransferase [Bordetella sp. 02P26C-1]
MTESLIAIVPAAGVGQRATRAGDPAVPKQYRLLAGEPMLRHAVRALLADPRIARVFVAVSEGDPWAEAALAGLPRTECRSCGGPTRADTVMAALGACGARDSAWVLVHDAARPGLPAEALGRLIDACLPDAVGGLLAQPVADTVKSSRSAEQGSATRETSVARVRATVDRDGLWLAQTPQMFRAGQLRQALAYAQANGVSVTDEASAIEASGHSPLLVPGSVRNFKVTWPDDFELMEKWL